MARYKQVAKVLVILTALALVACPAAWWGFQATALAAPVPAPPSPPVPPAGNDYPAMPEVAGSFLSPFITGLPPVSMAWVVLASLVIAGLACGTIALAIFGDHLYMAKAPTSGCEARISELEAELRARTEELEAAEEAADLYIDTVSHDICNQNHIAMGYLELAAMRLPSGSEEKELVDKPRDALEASTGFIRSLQNIQLARAGKLEPKMIDLDTLLASLADEIALEGGLALRYGRQPGSLVRGNELLPEAFRSIIRAIIRFSMAPATIEMSLSGYAEAGRNYYRVTVESDGPGLPEELKGRLFAPRQAGQPTGGLRGPGLYLSRMAIEACGGKIWAEDLVCNGIYKGCRFVVLLPADSATGEVPGTGSSAAGT